MESNLCDPVRIYVTVCACVVDRRIKCNLCMLCLPWLPLVPVHHSLQPCGPAAGCSDVPACLGLPPSAGPALVSGRPSFSARVRSKHRSSIFPDLALAPRLPETFPDTFPPLPSRPLASQRFHRPRCVFDFVSEYCHLGLLCRPLGCVPLGSRAFIIRV